MAIHVAAECCCPGSEDAGTAAPQHCSAVARLQRCDVTVLGCQRQYCHLHTLALQVKSCCKQLQQMLTLIQAFAAVGLSSASCLCKTCLHAVWLCTKRMLRECCDAAEVCSLSYITARMASQTPGWLPTQTIVSPGSLYGTTLRRLACDATVPAA